jgi:hypothetical protein
MIKHNKKFNNNTLRMDTAMTTNEPVVLECPRDINSNLKHVSDQQ